MSESKEVTREEFVEQIAAATTAAEAHATAGRLAEGVDCLLAVEKKTRLAGDAHSTGDACVAIVKLLWANKDYEALNANVLVLSKRRSQLKLAVTKMVQEVYTYVDEIADRDARVALITTLRTVTDGKIYVEIERARLTMKLALQYESEGDVSKASDTLQEIAVETFSGMEKREKAEFLLEQVRLCHGQRDFVRMQITANKVSKKILDEDEMADLKLRYYNLMIDLHSEQKNASALWKDWQAIYHTKGVKDDVAQWTPALQSIVVYLCVSVYDHEVSDMQHRLLLDPHIDDIPVFKRLLTLFTTEEIIPWPLPEAPELITHPTFAQESWFKTLRQRITQHNLRIVSKYYTRIQFSRLCSVLSLTPEETEAEISSLVSDKALYAKMDRPAGIVHFLKPRQPAEILSDWSGDVTTLLGLVERTTHLINKENMVHGVVSAFTS